MLPLCTWGTEPPAEFEKNWPQWRGPFANGVAPHANPPVEWSEDKNVRWKITLPGKGHATPIVWGDHVFVLAAIETDKKGEPRQEEQAQTSESGNRGRGRGGRGWKPPSATTTNTHQFAILAINRSDGKIAWQQIAREEMPHEGTHATGSWASNSPVTDGGHIYAYFGSRGLYCFDMKGNLQWENDFGDMRIKLAFGEGSSPVLYGDRLIVNWDHEGQSFIVVLDKKTGKELWRANREENTSLGHSARG
jgi:outer membrane protein assembly factor BamB